MSGTPNTSSLWAVARTGNVFLAANFLATPFRFAGTIPMAMANMAIVMVDMVNTILEEVVGTAAAGCQVNSFI